MSEIGQRIRELRQALKMTQDRLAKVLGIHRGHLANLELGKSEPSEHLILLICEKFEVNLEWMKHGQGEMTSSPDLDPEQVRKLEKMLESAPFKSVITHIDLFLSMHEKSTEYLVHSFRQARKANPDYCPPELIESLRKLLSKREQEPFKTAERMLHKLEPHASGGMSGIIEKRDHSISEDCEGDESREE